MKKLRERVVSWVLSLAMLLTFVPAGLFPSAQAAGNSISLSVNAAGKLVLTVSGGTASSNTGNIVFVLYPNFHTSSNTVEDVKGAVTDTFTQASQFGVLSGYYPADAPTIAVDLSGKQFGADGTVSIEFDFPSGMDYNSLYTKYKDVNLYTGTNDTAQTGRTSYEYIAFFNSGTNPKILTTKYTFVASAEGTITGDPVNGTAAATGIVKDSTYSSDIECADADVVITAITGELKNAAGAPISATYTISGSQGDYATGLLPMGNYTMNVQVAEAVTAMNLAATGSVTIAYKTNGVNKVTVIPITIRPATVMYSYPIIAGGTITFPAGDPTSGSKVIVNPKITNIVTGMQNQSCTFSDTGTSGGAGYAKTTGTETGEMAVNSSIVIDLENNASSLSPGTYTDTIQYPYQTKTAPAAALTTRYVTIPVTIIVTDNAAPTTHDVTFDANRPADATGTVTGLPVPNPQTVNNGATVSYVTLSGLTNYNFTGWATTSTASSATWTSGASAAITQDTTFYAVWEKVVTTYDATVNITVDGTPTDIVSVTLKNSTDSTTKAMSTTSTAGTYTATGIDNADTFDQVVVVTSSGSYTVDLGTAISVTHKTAAVPLYTIGLGNYDTDAFTAVTLAGGTASVIAPSGTELALAATVNTTKHYTFKTWTQTADVGKGTFGTATAATTTYTVGTTADTLTPTADAHPHLTLDPASGSITVREGYSAQDIQTGEDGQVKNDGSAATGELAVSITNSDTFNTASDSTGTAAKLTATLTNSAALAANGTTGLTVNLATGLTQGSHTAYVWVYDATNNIQAKYTVSITVSEASAMAINPGTVAWDTYTQTISGSADTTAALTVALENLTSVDKVVLNGTTPTTLTLNADYTVALNDGGTTSATATLTLTTDGLKKIAGLGGGTLTVTAKDSANAVKTGNVTVTLADSMPSVAGAAFSGTVTDGKWTKGSAAPTLTVTTTSSPSTLNGPVTYKWYVNGVELAGESSDTLSSTALNALNVGDNVKVEVTGTTAPGTAKPADGTELYRNTVTKSASFTVAARSLTVTVKRTVDGTDYTGSDITASATTTSVTEGSSTTVTTATSKPNGYRFVGWSVDNASNGSFTLAGTIANNSFTPANNAIITAAWVSLAHLTLEGAATGPDATGTDAGAKYNGTIKNDGAGAATDVDVSIDDMTHFVVSSTVSGGTIGVSDEPTFTITPVTGANAPTPGTQYTIKVTVAYKQNSGDTSTVKVTKTIVYTVPLPKWNITLKANTMGTITGNYSGSTYTTNPNDQIIAVTQGHPVAITATPNNGYKFVQWKVTPPAGGTDDKFLSTSSASTQYGGVTRAAEISAEFKAVTDLSETSTKTAASATVAYAGTPNVFTGTLTNKGALAANMNYELKNQKKDGTTTGTYFALDETTSTVNLAAIAAQTGSTAGTGSVLVHAVNGLGVGTYTADLVISETTDDSNTMGGTAQTWTIPITFTVTAATTFTGKVQVKLNDAYKNGETVKLHPDSVSGTGSDIPLTVSADNDYTTATPLSNTETYSIILNGTDTGLNLTSGSTSQLVQLWSIKMDIDPSSLSTKPNAIGTGFTVTGATAGSTTKGYLNGSSVVITAGNNTGYVFTHWTSTSESWSNATDKTSNLITLTMAHAVDVTAHYDKMLSVIYRNNLGGSDATVFFTDGGHTKADTAVDIIASVPSRAGYTFVGWSSNSSQTADNWDAVNNATDYGPSETVDLSGGADVILYAIWKQVEAQWSTLPSGTYGAPYSGSVAITNGAAVGAISSYTIDVRTAGSDETAVSNLTTLGFTYNQTTGAIGGTPYQTGKFVFTVTATNAAGDTWTHDYTLNVGKAQPTISAVSFCKSSGDMITDNMSRSDVEVNGVVTVPYWNGTNWTAVTSFTFAHGSAPSPNPGALALTDTSGNLVFNGATSLTEEVTFTPGTNVTSISGQKFEDIYSAATTQATITLGAKTYDIEVTPNQWSDSVNVGYASYTDPTFAVENLGNQTAYLTYELANPQFNGQADALTIGSGFPATLNQAGSASNTSATGTINVKASLPVGVYTATLVVKNYSEAAHTTLKKTVNVPLIFVVNATNYNITVETILNTVAGTNNPGVLPAGNVVLTQIDDPSKTVTATWDGSTSKYTATGLAGKMYFVSVNGYTVPGMIVSAAAASKTVNLYEVKLVNDTSGTGTVTMTATPAYLAAGQTGSVTAPANVTNGSNTYDFEKWVKDTGSDAHTTSNTFAYPMDYASPAAVTFHANYKLRAADTVTIHYDANLGSSTVVVVVPGDATVSKGGSATLATGAPVRTGYTFVGWSTDETATKDDFDPNNNNNPVSGGSNRYDAAPGATISALSNDLTLYAVWAQAEAKWPGTAGSGSTAGMQVLADGVYGSTYAGSVAVLNANETGPVTYEVSSGTLPGGLALNTATGEVTGKPYQVDSEINFTIKATSTADASVTWTQKFAVTVGKAQSHLTNISGTGAVTGAAFSTGTYTVDVVAPILKTKGADPTADEWETITVATGVKLSTGDTTTAANGGVLSLVADGTFASGSNTVGLTWTPGASSGSYPLTDANGSNFGAIYLTAQGNAIVSTTGDIYTMTVTPTAHTWTVEDGYSVASKDSTHDGVTDTTSNTAYGKGFVLTNTGNQATGTLQYKFGTATGNDAAGTYFEMDTGWANTALPATSNNTLAFSVKPVGDLTPGTYTDTLTITDTAHAGSSAVVYNLVLVVKEASTFSFEVDTMLHSFNAAGAGTSALGDVNKVTLVSGSTVIDKIANNGDAGKYSFTGLSSALTYTVKVNDYPVAGVTVAKGGTSPVVINLYELAVDKDANGSNPPTKSPNAQYYLAQQPVTVTAAAGNSGYDFKDWTLTVEGGASDDAVTTNYKTDKAITYVMGSAAARLYANYTAAAKKYNVVLNANSGAIGYYDAETHVNVLTGGTVSGSDYVVTENAAFGLPVAVATASTGNYTATRDGYTFLGWSLDQNAASGGYTFTANDDADSADGSTNGTITLYAVWKADSSLAFTGGVIKGVYKHALVNQEVNGATGGNGASYTYDWNNQADKEPFGITMGSDGAFASVVNTTPNDVGIQTVKIQVEDADGTVAVADYIFEVEKADVKPQGSLPTDAVEVELTATEADTKTDIKNAFGSTVMDGDGTGENSINGSWAVKDGWTKPTKPGTYTVPVVFTPANNNADPAHPKDGDHYNTYTANITLVVKAKLITAAAMAVTAPTMNGTPMTLAQLQAASNSLTSVGNNPIFVSGNTGDVVIEALKWTPESVQFNTTIANAALVTLRIQPGSDYLFDTATFSATIAGNNATIISINDTTVTFQYEFPKENTPIKVIDVTTGTPVIGTSTNTVSVPVDHYNEYTITYQWVKTGTTDEVTGASPFADGSKYDLLVTVTPKVGYAFDATRFQNKAATNELKDGNAWYATVNNAATGDNAKTATVQTVYNNNSTPADPTDDTLTIRYADFTPQAKKIIGLKVEGAPGAYYAQTDASGKHHNGDATGTLSSLTTAPFAFSKSGITVYPIYDGDGVGTTPLPVADWNVVGKPGTSTTAAAVPASFADGYNSKQDVADWDGKTLTVQLAADNDITADVPGTLIVRTLQATGITTTAAPTLTYAAGTNFAPGSGTATVTFNPGIALANAVSSLTVGTKPTTVTTAAAAGDNRGTFYYMLDTHGTDNKITDDDTPLTGSTPITAQMNGKDVYACYTDVNGNLVYTKVGTLAVSSSFTVTITDANDGDYEYGDVLTATPSTGAPDDYEYKWERWNPSGNGGSGAWEPIPGATGQTYVPGKDGTDGGVGDHIRVTVTDKVTNSVSSSTADNSDGGDTTLVHPRSLNFVVAPINKTYDGDKLNKHSYTDADFTLVQVPNPVTGAYGGLVTGDTVTLTPVNAGSADWNDAAATRPAYADKTVGSQITWPAVAVNAGTAVGQTGGYTLSDAVNYRLDAQGEQTARGKILDEGDITPIVVEYSTSTQSTTPLIPTKGGTPASTLSDFAAPSEETRYKVDLSATSSFKWEWLDGSTWKTASTGSGLTADGKFLESTKYRVTVPVQTVDGNYFAADTNPGYYILNGVWYPATSTAVGNTHQAKATVTWEFPATEGPTDPINVTYVSAFFQNPPTAGEVIPAHPNFVGRPVETVSTDANADNDPDHFIVRWYTGRTYGADGTVTNAGTSVTADGTAKFLPGKAYSVEVDVKPGVGYAYNLDSTDSIMDTFFAINTSAGTNTAQAKESGGVYTMYFTFGVTGKKVTAITGVTGSFTGPYYADTGVHTSANNSTTPGAQSGAGFALGYTIDSITVTYDDNTSATLSSAGTAAEQALFNSAKVNVGGVTLANNYPFTQKTGDVVRFDGKDVFVQIGDVVSSGTVKLTNSATSDKLVVKELEADKISTADTLTTTVYDVTGSTKPKFDATGITAANVKVDFNTGVAILENAGYNSLTQATTDSATESQYYFQLDNGTILVDGSTEITAGMDGRDVYLCYTDVNGHTVKTTQALATLSVNSGNDVIIQTVVPPVAGETIVQPTVDAGKPYELVTTAKNTWQKYDAGSSDYTDMTAGDTFAAGNQYQITATVKVKDGQSFPITSGTQFWLGGMNIPQTNPPTGAAFVDNGNGTYTVKLVYTIPQIKVHSVNTSVTQPTDGGTIADADVSVIQTIGTDGSTMTDNVTVGNLKWYKGSESTATNDQTFAAGNTYKAEFDLTVPTGYEYQNEAGKGVSFVVSGVGPIVLAGDATLSNHAITKVTTSTTDATTAKTVYHVVVEYDTVTVNKANLTDVVVNASTPAAGELLTGPAVDAGKPYSLTGTVANSKWQYWNGTTWADASTNTGLDAAGKFLPGTRYQVTAEVKLVDTTAYQITTGTKFYLAGVECGTTEIVEAVYGNYTPLVPSAAAGADDVYGSAVTYQLTQRFEIPAKTVGVITVSYPEPVKGATPAATPSFLEDTAQVEVSGTAWYSVALATAGTPAAADFTGGTSAATFVPDTYYRVDATIEAKGDYVLNPTGKVTINGITVTVDGAMVARTDASGAATGWAMATYDAGSKTIKAMFLSKTVAENKIITDVTTGVTRPVAEGTPAAKSDTTLATNSDGLIVTTSGMTDGGDVAVTWKEWDESNNDWTSSTWTSTDSFGLAKRYQATFTLTTNSTDGYTYKDHASDNTKRVLFHAYGMSITGAGSETNADGITVTTTRNSDTSYTVVVEFPATTGKTPITEVTVNYTDPVRGANPAASTNYTPSTQVTLKDDALVSDNADNGTTWHKGATTSGTVVTETHTFDDGPYTVYANFKAKDDYKFDSNTKFIIEGVTATTNKQVSADGTTAQVWYTFPGLDKTIVKVETGVTAPVPGGLIPSTASTTVAVNKVDTNLLPKALASGGAATVTWTKSTDNASWTAAGASFEHATYYKAEFTLTPETGYDFLNYAATAAGTDWTDFIVNQSDPINGAGTATIGTTSPTTVKVEKATGNAYKITLTFPKTPDNVTNVLNVYVNTVLPPEDGRNVPSVYEVSTEPYEPNAPADLKWEVSSDGTTGWTTAAAGTPFVAGKHYRVTGTAKLKTLTAANYDITTATKFYIGGIEIPTASAATGNPATPGNPVTGSGTANGLAYTTEFKVSKAAVGTVYPDDTVFTVTLTYTAGLADKTDPTIVKVAANALFPVTGVTIPNTVTGLLAQNKDGVDMLGNVTFGQPTWKEESGGSFVGTSDSTFVNGKVYQVEFTVAANSGYHFLNDTTAPQPDFVDYLINSILDGGQWINGATSAAGVTDNGITVVTAQDGNSDKYKITVTFPAAGAIADVLTVWGNVAEPTAGGAINVANITVAGTEPYKISDGTKTWEHYNTTNSSWEAAGSNFVAGEKYRASLQVEIKNDYSTQYRFVHVSNTEKTEGYINDTTGTTTVDFVDGTGTADHPQYVTLSREFTVPKTQVYVRVSSSLPVVDKTPTEINGTIAKPANADTGYTLDTGNAKWYNANGSAATAFEAGKTYTMKVEVTPGAGYTLPSGVNGYYWDEGYRISSKIVAGSDGKYTAEFTYSIPSGGTDLTPVINVKVPVKGESPSNAVSPNNSVTITNTTWTPAGTFAAGNTYKVKITIDPNKPGGGLYAKDDVIQFNTGTATIKEDGSGNLYIEESWTIPNDTISGGNTGGGGGGGGGSTSEIVVTYWLGETGVTKDLTAETVKKNKYPANVPSVTGISGYKFLGWSETNPSKTSGKPKLVDPTTFKITGDKTFYAVYETEEGHTAVDHSHYVIGYPNGTFGPTDDITRGSVATIIARACLEGFVEGSDYGNPGNYSDVANDWAYSAISFCTINGVFKGYDDGTFRPGQPITRQEFATVIARLAGIQSNQGMPFSDAGDIASWAVDGVYTTYANGWVNGYTDGTFKPLSNIHRDEAVKIFNGYLNRGVDAVGLSELTEYVHSGVASHNTENGSTQYMTWPDVPKGHWAYYEIIEAANDHTFYWPDETKPVPPEHWMNVWIDETWLYHDNANDGGPSA